MRIVSSTGRACLFDRSIVTALIAELVAPLAQAPWPFLERTDLLDFPGARSREKHTEVDAYLAVPENLGHAFLRGKVDYLFQRYQAEGEITAMLLCVGDSVQDVQTLPGMVDRWVGEAIGRTPQERQSQRDTLFLVLTKFDTQFVHKAGEDVASGERWTARINASLLGFFKSCAWVKEWKPGRPFDNVSWLRSTSIGFDAVFDYEGSGATRRELGISPRARDSVAARQTAYLANPLVTRHISQAARAWDEALRPGDGGISYLASRLDPICDVAVKLEQVAAQVERLALSLVAQLRPHYRSGDLDEERRKALAAATALARPLTQCAAAQMFGPTLRALVVSRDQMVAVWRSFQARPEIEAAPVGAVSNASDLFGQLFGETEPPETELRIVQDQHDQFADMALEEWTRTMNAFAADPATETSLRIPLDQATVLVAGLSALAGRLRLREHLAAVLRSTCGHQSRITMTGEKQAAIASGQIGGFVTQLGYRDVAEAQRPVSLDDKTRRVFAPRAPVDGLPPLGEAPSTYTTLFLKDWISALVRRFEENAGAVDADGFDAQANAALGTILSRLQAAA